MKEYKSVLKEASTEIIEKKSRFICNVKPIKNEEEAHKYIKTISEIHKAATHNVFAYVVIDNVEIQRASDDGEPQGTAGIPVLEVIKKEGLINVCVVVTRYFGGILLGGGGLIRAYSSAARSGLIEAQISTLHLYNKFKIDIGYTYLGKVQNTINAIGNTIIQIDYTDSVSLFVAIRHDRVEQTLKMINEATYGEACTQIIENIYDI